MRLRFILLFVLIAAVLNACGSSGADVTSTPVPTDTALVPPTETASPAEPLAILVVPADLDPETSSLYQKTVYDLAQASGLRFQVRNTLTAADLEPGLKVVVVFPPDPGLAALAATAPQVQFLAINMPEIPASGNISVLGGNTQSDVAAFLAGYTAAMLTDDYRIGMLMPKDNPDAIRALNAYATGMKFQCGVCRQLYFYNWSYPQYLDIAAAEDPANYDAYADILIMQYRVGTIYVYPDIATQDLVNYIGMTGVYMIGSVSPAQRPPGWVMTIQPDVVKGIQSAWPGLVAGQGGVTVQSPLGLADVDPSLLSPGKQQDVERILGELQAGRISTVANP
ncbi:MAG: hypothetical protein WCC12_07970 [Anaerolineales bacterium]